MVVRFFFIVSLEVAVVEAVCFFGSVALLFGCDSFFAVRYGLFLFWGNVGVGVSFVVPGVNFGVTSSIVQVFSINC